MMIIEWWDYLKDWKGSKTAGDQRRLTLGGWDGKKWSNQEDFVFTSACLPAGPHVIALKLSDLQQEMQEGLITA